MKDAQNIEILDINQPMYSFKMQAERIWGPRWKDMLSGILKDGDAESVEERRRMQEHHNARHALWFLSMVVHGIVHDKPEFVNPQKKDKILAHLIFLREFIDCSEVRFAFTVQRLIGALVADGPVGVPGWSHFLRSHWDLIRTFAARYRCHEKCFSHTQLNRINDAIQGRRFFRYWWWHMVVGHRAQLFIRKFKVKLLGAE